MIIPTGSDASIQHRPLATMGAVALCGLVSLILWICWPKSFLDGETAIIHAEDIALAEKFTAAVPDEDPAVAATAAADEEAKDRKELGEELRKGFCIDGDTRRPVTTAERDEMKKSVAEYLSDGLITKEAAADLNARLDQCPVVAIACRHLWGECEGAGDLPIVADDAKRLVRELAEARDRKDISVAEHDRLAALLARRRPSSKGYLMLWPWLHGKKGETITDAQRDRLVQQAGELQASGELSAEDRAEIDRQLGQRKVVSKDLASLSHCDESQVPWFMMPFGAWSWPWSWLASVFVHAHWRDTVLGIGLLWSFGLVVEGKLGWRRFLPLLGGGILATGLITTLAGLVHGVVFPVAGSRDLVAFLAGVCLVWTPLNRITYTRWFGVAMGEFDLPIWGILAFNAVVNLIVGWLIGFPMLVVLILALAYPLLGAAVGTVLLRKGWAECDGWDIYSLWKTRGISASERNRLHREKGWAEQRPTSKSAAPAVAAPGAGSKSKARAIGPAPSAPAEDPAPLIAAAEQELQRDLAAGNAASALAGFRTLRVRWPSWKAPAATCDRLAKILWQAGSKGEAAEVATVLVDGGASAEAAADARVILAARALDERKPATVRRHLDALPSPASPRQAAQADLLRRKAAELESQGVHEVEFE